MDENKGFEPQGATAGDMGTDADIPRGERPDGQAGTGIPMRMRLDGAPGHEGHDASPAPTASGSDDHVVTPSEAPGPDGQDIATNDASEANGGDEGTGTEKLAVPDLPDWHDRLPIILGVITVVCFIIMVTSFGLQWMARHGGGTGDPVEASSEVDNTPIPTPHVTSINMVNMSFPAGMTFRLSVGGQSVSWDGASTAGDLPAEVSNTASGTVAMALILPEGDDKEMVVDFISQADQPFLSFNISMGTKENGILTIAGTINNLPSAGTARISPMDYRVGITNTDEAATVFPVVNVTTSYTVGDENKDYVGSYVSTGASLTMGTGTNEAYLAADTRNVTLVAPAGFGQGNILQASRTTIRQNGQQNSIMGTTVLTEGDTEFSASYEDIAENDESSSIMGRDVSLIHTETVAADASVDASAA